MGSKRRIAKHIVPIMLRDIRPDQHFVDLFCGGCNLISAVDHPLRIANDINKPLIALHEALVNGWQPPKLTKTEYYHIKENQWLYEPYLVGYACFCASFSGKPFSGFADIVKGKSGVIRDYQDENRRNVLLGAQSLANISFSNSCFTKLKIPNDSIVYCDIPYKSTTGYRVKFDHAHFYDWCRERAYRKQKTFISEYWMPEDFVCIWYLYIVGGLGHNGMHGGSPLGKTEKLFVHKTQLENWML